MQNHIDAVIFDCDGVLVDSEVLSLGVSQRVLADLGWAVELPAMLEMFMGCSHAFYVAQIEKNIGRSLEPDWALKYAHWYEKAFADGLREVEGISKAVEQIELPTAVASNSRHSRIRSSLELVGLLEKFDGRICSAEDVKKGKPAPDVYLRAALLLGVPPERCVAVEDSKSGIEAALSASMRVLAYETKLTPTGWFDRSDITVFHSMAALPGLVRELSERGEITRRPQYDR